MTDELVKDLRQNQGGWCPTAVIVKAANTIEAQSNLLGQALEALNSVVLYDYQGLPCGISNEWEKSILLSATVEAIKQFKEQK